MRTFSLDSRLTEGLTGLEFEVAQEQAESLGAAGKKLQEAIDRFNEGVRQAHNQDDHEKLLSEVASRAWALLVQRELVGFKHDNVQWVMDHFDLPDEALSRVGQSATG